MVKPIVGEDLLCQLMLLSEVQREILQWLGLGGLSTNSWKFTIEVMNRVNGELYCSSTGAELWSQLL
jgi:hypothetical protein